MIFIYVFLELRFTNKGTDGLNIHFENSEFTFSCRPGYVLNAIDSRVVCRDGHINGLTIPKCTSGKKKKLSCVLQNKKIDNLLLLFYSPLERLQKATI
jgi:hypothetical protein